MSSCPEKIRICIVEDHHIVRAGLRLLLEKIGDFLVAGEACTGAGAIDIVRELRPDVLTLDIGLPDIPGLEVLEALAASGEKKPAIVVLSMHANEEHVLRAISLGAGAYVLKDEAPDALERAIRSALRGVLWLSDSISSAMLDHYISGRPLVMGGGSGLTERQRQILRMVALGGSNKGIAYELNLSVKTVENHRTQIMEKLDIHDVAGLVRYAIRYHLIAP